MADHDYGPEMRASFETHPSIYHHWNLSFDGPVATLTMKVDEQHPMKSGYALKLNSYDFSVDVELADAINRLRFGHPEVRCLVVTSSFDRIFCAGANIYMLGASSHPFKVNFCKYTNETRISLEDYAHGSGVHTIAALNGTASGGGYELAIACEEILLVDDGNSAVSLPEVPLLGVLPGTGGLTRLVDKRKVRRDFADVFSTIAEGVKGKRAKQMRLVDDVLPKGTFMKDVMARAQARAAKSPAPASATGLDLCALPPVKTDTSFEWRHVTLTVDRATRVASIEMRGPGADEPIDPAAMLAKGNDLWALRAFRELDLALLELRMNEPLIGIVRVKTLGSAEAILRVDQALDANRASNWFVREVVLHMARVLRRFDATAKSFFTLAESGCAFVGCLLELSLAADRTYALEDGKVKFGVSGLNGGALPMSHGMSRLAVRFYGEPGADTRVLSEAGRVFDSVRANELGLVTFLLDDIDYDDEVRVAVEERASLSPDALTGMEASLRFAGPENCDSKIFGRLTAWQNWIFQRPNAVGEKGALTCYGKPQRPQFDYRRT